MPAHQSENDIDAEPDPAMEQRNSETAESRLDAAGWALLRWWGVLFRIMFISLLGIISYFWLDPKSLGNVPLAQLTLNQIFGNLFAILIPLGCIGWFFSFPDQSESRSAKDNPYVLWGQFGGWVVGLAVLAIYWLSKQ